MNLRFLLLLGLIAIGGQLSAETNPDMPGLVVERDSGGYLALNLEDNSLVLRFYDAGKTQIAPEAPRAMAFWRFRTKRNREPLTLQGNVLRSPQRIFPPFAYHVNISLLTMEDNDVTESHNFDMRHFQPPTEKDLESNN